MLPDFYEVLGVNRKASTEEIRAAYKRMLRQVHPDSGGNAGLFRLVQQAWETLGDSTKRTAYDREQAADGPTPGNGRPSSAGPDDYWRGYAEEAGRERFREEQLRQEREAQQRRSEQQEREREAHRADEDRQRAEAARQAIRSRPYADALTKLTKEERDLHTRNGVPLSYLLKLNRLQAAQLPTVAIIAGGIALTAAVMIMGTTSLEPISYWFAFIFNVVAIFLGLGFFLTITTSALLWLAKTAAPRRTGMSAVKLQEEYLSRR